MADWQPIETAPQDGTRVLVGSFGRTTKPGLMAVDWYRTDARPSKHGYIGWGLFNKEFFPATHWQPLPEPPEA